KNSACIDNEARYNQARQDGFSEKMSFLPGTTYAVKREWRKVRGMPWKAMTLDVELDLSKKDEKKPRWQPLRLLFVQGLKEPSEAQVGKKDWALFLRTDIRLSMSKMLEIYALR
ncbi:MAG: hypothetical protein KZQ66_06420, partial [Candidatus Thiodiazotropha sp. (ex Lucinoma aequizonata)]|nr:hypothetical protein [Candidatus Thiodiazotropha sp. (ex Lucinoma aequizonata)]